MTENLDFQGFLEFQDPGPPYSTKDSIEAHVRVAKSTLKVSGRYFLS